MSNINAINQDIQWLNRLFKHRWECMYLQASTHEKFTSLANDAPTIESSQPLTFLVTHHDFEQLVFQQSFKAPASQVLLKGTFLYHKPNELYQAKGETHPYFINPQAQAYSVVEISNGWVRFRASLHQFTDDTKTNYQNVTNGLVWLPITSTDLPADYQQDFSWVDFEAQEEHWTESQRLRVQKHLAQKDRIQFWENFYAQQDVRLIQPPAFEGIDQPYTRFVAQHQLSIEDRALLILSLVNSIQPDFLLPLIERSKSYPDVGGAAGQNFRGFLPTGETWLFLLAGRSPNLRDELLDFLLQKSRLLELGIVQLLPAFLGEPYLTGVLSISPDQERSLLASSTIHHKSK